jgi:hypothetical protein
VEEVVQTVMTGLLKHHIAQRGMMGCASKVWAARSMYILLNQDRAVGEAVLEASKVRLV